MTATEKAPKVDTVYYGHREAMIAEAGTPSYYKGKYLVHMHGDGNWDAEGFSSIRAAVKHALYLAEIFHAKACRVD